MTPVKPQAVPHKIRTSVSVNVHKNASQTTKNARLLKLPAIPNRSKEPRGARRVRMDTSAISIVVGDNITWFAGKDASQVCIIVLNRIHERVFDAQFFS